MIVPKRCDHRAQGNKNTNEKVIRAMLKSATDHDGK